jgi:hypothetical protein
MDQSVFIDKAAIPDDEGLKQALGDTFNLW